jgi:regulator of replication initiation timing
MDTSELLAAINLLAQRLEHTPEDLHEVHFKVKEMIEEIQATGMPPPDDLVEFEKDLAKRVDEAEN